MTYDAGARWGQLPLPVPAASIRRVTAAAGRGVWLAVPRRGGVALYRQPPDPHRWLRTILRATPGAHLDDSPPDASVYLGPGGIITVVLTWGLTGTTAINRVFLSTDDGTTFTTHPAGPPFYILGVAFTDALHGLSVCGPTGADSHLFRTADGGASWTPVTNPVRLDADQQLEFSPPTATGSTLRLPATINDPTSTQQVRIYTSSDGGRTFTATTNSPPLRSPARFSAGEESVAVLGDEAWVPARGVIYETTDIGRTWTPTRSATQPETVSLIDAAHAIGVIPVSGCRHYKSDCYDYAYLAETSDNGRTWRRI